MKIVVIDGQGGRIGSLFIEKWKKQNRYTATVIAIGTNSASTLAMIKAGADGGATGENPVIVNVQSADYIIGPVGMIAADAFLGEVTPAMAAAVARSTAQKILIPVNLCNYQVAGVKSYSIKELIDDAVQKIQIECLEKQIK